jgi:glycerol-3-phosphate dehydrogenase
LSTPPPFSFSRDESLAQMARDEFDVCVIGAGINGAAIARDAALRGLKVALLEAGDFAGATSSRSSKLIHGGFRYLPRWEFGLVYHALRERERLRRITAQHLVSHILLLFPIYYGV